MDNFHLTERVAVVTGGAQGIGAAVARACATAGADVAIADVQLDAARATATAIAQETQRRALAVACDVTSLEQVAALAKTVEDELGSADILINNAGWDRFHFFMQTTPEFWGRVIAVNYTGVLNTCYTFLPGMIARGGGAIVNLASDAGRGGSMGEAVYAGCKAGVIAFSKTLAREHARDNVRVNVVAPGITKTGLFDAMSESKTGGKVMAAITRAVPLGRRAGEPDEIAPAVVFLASAAAGYITGQVLSVNGGLTMVD